VTAIWGDNDDSAAIRTSCHSTRERRSYPVSADLSTGSGGETADNQPEQREHLPKGGALLVGIMVVSAFVVILNETIMSVALPRLMEDLHISASTAQWLTSGFLLTMATIIPLSGFILQRFTERAVYLAAIGLF